MEGRKLILQVQKRPILYVPTHTEYKDVKKKQLIWQDIGKRLSMSGESSLKLTLG